MKENILFMKTFIVAAVSIMGCATKKSFENTLIMSKII